MGKRSALGIGPAGGGSISTCAAIRRPVPKTLRRPLPASAPLPKPAGAYASPAAPAKSGPAQPAARRGCLSAALLAARSVGSMEAAVSDLVRDKYAASSHKTRAAWLRTWVALHEAAHAMQPAPPPPFPLTPDGITRTAALFKAGGYLSFANYAFRAKSEHLSMELCGPGAWSAELSESLKGAIRSCDRDVGTSRQSKPVDVVAVAGLGLDDSPVVPGGPVAPADFVVAGSFFLLREIELAAARTGHVTFGADRLSVSWLLPSSKTDHRAVGVSRSWDWCCLVESLRPVCPVCALGRQHDRAMRAAARFGVAVADFPLFFAENGEEVSKPAAVATIERLVELIGLPTRSAAGSHLYGGHSLRTGGAALLAGRGVNPFRIQSLGRWKSPLVVHYAGEALAHGLAGELARTAAETGPVSAEIAELRRFVESVDRRLDRLELSEPAPHQPTASDSSTTPLQSAPERIVINLESGVYHRTPASAELPKSYCGWRYEHRRKFSFVDAVPPGTSWRLICGYCLKDERELAKMEELSDCD